MSRRVLKPALSHRLIIAPAARVRGVTPAAVLDEVLGWRQSRCLVSLKVAQHAATDLRKAQLCVPGNSSADRGDIRAGCRHWLATILGAYLCALRERWCSRLSGYALSVRGITFSRSALGGRAQVGERVEERLSLENHSVIPKLWIQVSDGSTLPGHHAGYVSSVGPHQRIAWRAKTVCRRRGRFTLGPVTATTGDPLGLFRREIGAGARTPVAGACRRRSRSRISIWCPG